MVKQPLLNTYVSILSMAETLQELCKLVAAEKEYRIFIIGGADRIADKSKTNLERGFPQIIIVVPNAPHFDLKRMKMSL